MLIIDFRLRPPYGALLNVGMYADKKAADFYADNIGTSRPASARQESMELLFREMDENGINLGIVTGRMGHRKGNIPNAEIARLVETWPDRFAGLAGADAGNVRESIEEISRYCLDGPLRGVVLEPGAMARPIYPNDPTLYPIYEFCQKHSLPVQLMIGGRAGPDRSYSRPDIIERLAIDFPETNFIVAHGCWPYVREILGVCFYHKNIFLCPDLYFFNLPGQQDYVIAASGYLRKRFLFASAYPFIPLDCVRDFESHFPPDVLPDIMGDNAKRLLNL